MKWYKLLLFSVISGTFLTLSWYPYGLPFLIFFAFIPLFLMSDELLKKGSKFSFWKGFIFSYPAFLIWNAITTYWICYTTVPGGIAASVLNAMLMALVFGLWHCCRRHIRQKWVHPLLLITLWISFEKLHLNWDLTWPWLNLGNVFAVCPHWVQWYSITGALGGTLWVLLLNYLLYWIIVRERQHNRRAGWAYTIFLACLGIPAIISTAMYRHHVKSIDKSTPIEVILVQPNTEVWEEQYVLSNKEEGQRIIDVATPYLNEKVNLIVCPESSIAHSILLPALQNKRYDSTFDKYGCFALLDTAIAKYPNLNFILGLSTYEFYNHKATPTARQVDAQHYVDFHNSAVLYNKKQYAGHYHKSRLVPGVEALPFPKVFGFLGDMLVNLGGVSSSLGKDTCQRTFCFEAGGKTLKVGTAICYESIYGDLVGKFVRKGANVLTVITNDSWWKDSPGHKQHFEMSRLRAVETHRYVVRSANGGFSGVINPAGDIEKKTNYMERTAVPATVYAQQDTTFYTRHGDFIVLITLILTATAILYIISHSIYLRCRTKKQSL